MRQVAKTHRDARFIRPERGVFEEPLEAECGHRQHRQGKQPPFELAPVGSAPLANRHPCHYTMRSSGRRWQTARSTRWHRRGIAEKACSSGAVRGESRYHRSYGLGVRGRRSGFARDGRRLASRRHERGRGDLPIARSFSTPGTVSSWLIPRGQARS